MRAKEVLGVIESDSTDLIGSYDSTLKINKIGGVCEQVTTTGKNLVDIANFKLVKPDTRTKMFVYDTLPAGTYNLNVKLSATTEKVHVRLERYVSSSDYTQYTGVKLRNGNNVLTCTGETNRLYFFIDQASDDGSTADISDIMLSVEPLPYEPYTGGNPVPNPSYPQEIKKSVVSEIKTHGKNLIDLKRSGTNIKLPFPLKSGTYTMSFKSDIGGGFRMSNSTDTSQNSIAGSTTVNLNGYVVITLTTNFITNYINVSTNGNTISDIMLNEGDTALPYEPYKESVITLSQPIELNGIGDVQDTIEDGKVKRRFTEVVLYGMESWRTSGDGKVHYVIVNNAPMTHGSKIMSNHFKYGEWATLKKDEICLGNGDIKAIGISTESFTTLDELTTFLKSNTVRVVYELAEPVIEDLPLTDQLAVSWLKTFHGVTYVEFDGEVQPTLNSDYATNLEGAITLQAHADNKIGKANTLVNRAEDETQNFEVRVEHGLVYLYKNDVLHGIVGANNVNTNGVRYNTLNLRADTEADFIALTSKKTNAVCYYMNINKIPFTSNQYTEPHYFEGDMRLVGNLKATGGVWSEETHVMKMGVNGGAAQAVEWVYDQALGRWVLCTVTGQ